MTLDPLRSRRDPFQILLVEDDPGDALITREALESSPLAHELNVVVNGEEAIAYLRKTGEFRHVTSPDLVLLDLNLPRVDGRQVLAEVKGDPVLRSLPIVVLTTSDAESDVARTYELHANAYITKPVDYVRFHEVVCRIDEFFSSIVRLPNRARN